MRLEIVGDIGSSYPEDFSDANGLEFGEQLSAEETVSAAEDEERESVGVAAHAVPTRAADHGVGNRHRARS